MSRINLASWALRHKSIIYYFIAVLLTFGIFSFIHMGRMEDPSFTIRTMVIGASWPGASPEEMSTQVTDKLEEAIRDVPGLDYTRSFTDGGKSVIYVNLKDDVSTNQVRQSWTEIRNKVNDEWKNLPSGVQGPIINDRFDDVYGTIYAITGNDYSFEEKRQQAESIKRALLSVPHVKKIELIGVQQQTLHIEMDKDKLAAYHIKNQELLTAIKQQSTMVPAGMITTDTTNVYVRVNGLFNSIDEIRNLPLTIHGQIIRLGDIATATMDYSDPSQPLFFYNGTPAIGIAISMEDGANNIEFGQAIDEKMATLQGEIPVGLSINQVSNQPHIVQTSINTFSRSLLEAIIIVLAVSFVSLGLRSGIVVALTIPVVVCSTFIAMYLNHIDLHKVSLGALIISLGLLVDDAIIVVEMMIVKLEEGLDHSRAATAAFRSTALPMLSGTLITCAGFIPISLSKGMVAEFCASLFAVVALALLLSWIASVLVSPVLGYELIRVTPTTKDTWKSRVIAKLYDRFRRILLYALGHKRLVLLTTIGVFIVSLSTFPLLKEEFFPTSTRNEIILNMQFPQSSSLAYTKQQADTLSHMLDGDARIASYTTYVGEGSPRFVLTQDPELPRNNFMQAVIVTQSLSDRNSLYEELQNTLNTTYPSALITLQFLQTGPPSKYPIMLRVSGPEPDMVKTIANSVKEEMEQTPHVSDVAFDWPDTEPTAQIHIDPNKARALGVDSYAISLTLQQEISGMKVGEFYEGNQTIPIQFKLAGNVAHNLSVLQSLPIQTASGAYVPLSQIATISLSQEEGIIWHRNMKPTITVHGSLPPTVLANSVEKDIYQQLAPLRESLPVGYTIELDGATEKSEIALSNLLTAVPVLFFITMTILMFQLKKITLMIMAVLTAPLGLIGVVLSLVITRTPLGFMSILGIIALSGMIIRNSIILIDQIETHRANGEDVRQAVIDSTLLRFRPIMLTAMAAILGMIPLMSDVFWAPMAIAFSGGLFVATVLTLIVLPVMYATWYERNH